MDDATAVSAGGVLDALSSALASARGAVSGLLDLIALEARLASLAFMWMVVWGIVAALCIVVGWLGVMASLTLWAVSFGLSPPIAMLAVAAINLAAGVILLYVCVRISRGMLFVATRRQVAGRLPSRRPTS